MICLGIESTAHTLGIGITKNGKVIANEMDTYKPEKEGILPRKAADHHAECMSRVLGLALSEAGLKMQEIDLIAFSQGPGIGAPLAVGTAGAKYLAHRFGKKIIGVNHCYAHIAISEYLTGLHDPLVLYLSGGNSQILVREVQCPVSSAECPETRNRKPDTGNWKLATGNWHVLGETLDIGIGNLFDTFGRSLGMKYAHGAELEKLASKGKYVELPYSVKGMNLVFSGLLTAAEKKLKTEKKEDVAHSLMETSFAMACEATERALFLTKKKKLVLCGGVAQNTRLKTMLKTMCDDDGVKFGVAPDEFNRDNGAMIAYAGSELYKKYGDKPVEFWEAIPNYRIELMDKVH
jgi:N6-L-threonylcarbamoyladenine synthase